MRQRTIVKIIFVIVCCSVAIGIGHDKIKSYYECYRAERFVKENIAGYGWIDNRLTDARTGDTLPFTPYDYETLYIAKDTLDSLRRCTRSTRTVYRDEELLNDDSLRIIVREALTLWHNSPYARHLSFDDFCEYLLPYRAGKEKLDFAYRDTIRRRYAAIADSVGDPVAAAIHINRDLKKRVMFDLRSHALLNEPSPTELMTDAKGSCRAISALFVQVMRTMGIPAAIDECPVWAHRNSGHEWTVVMDTAGRWRAFEPAEYGPDEFSSVNEHTRTPKIFRRTFSFDHSFYPPAAPADMPPLFTTFNRRDVTREYVSVSDVTVTPDRNLDKSNGILYLAVFNAEAWRPVAWAELNGRGEAHFAEMGNNSILYLPVFYRNGRSYPAGSPFVLDRSGKMYPVETDRTHRRQIEMKFVNLYWTTVWDTFVPAPGRQLELYVWDDQWVFCDSTRSGSAPDYRTQFEDVPTNGIYWIRGPWDNTWQRPFMIDSTGGGTVWY